MVIRVQHEKNGSGGVVGKKVDEGRKNVCS